MLCSCVVWMEIVNFRALNIANNVIIVFKWFSITTGVTQKQYCYSYYFLNTYWRSVKIYFCGNDKRKGGGGGDMLVNYVTILVKGSSINDVTPLRGRDSSRFFDDICQYMRDVIYRQPRKSNHFIECQFSISIIMFFDCQKVVSVG